MNFPGSTYSLPSMAAVAFPFLPAPWRGGLKVSRAPFDRGSEIFCLLDRRPEIVVFGAATGVEDLSCVAEEETFRFRSTSKTGPGVVEVEMVPAAEGGAREPVR
jgi:hypothetical protein